MRRASYISPHPLCAVERTLTLLLYVHRGISVSTFILSIFSERGTSYNPSGTRLKRATTSAFQSVRPEILSTLRYAHLHMAPGSGVGTQVAERLAWWLRARRRIRNLGEGRRSLARLWAGAWWACLGGDASPPGPQGRRANGNAARLLEQEASRRIAALTHRHGRSVVPPGERKSSNACTAQASLARWILLLTALTISLLTTYYLPRRAGRGGSLPAAFHARMRRSGTSKV